MSSRATNKRERTDKILTKYNGRNDEWTCLWAIMTLSYDWDHSHNYDELIDTVAIADRLDVMKAEMTERMLKDKD